ncbi:MAG: RsbRD N-terminal domain-containing protein [SAR324 cluster bacterium]|nr:RsbRD N-terminal domain-containing protein [SAR324 cluster bacterium]
MSSPFELLIAQHKKAILEQWLMLRLGIFSSQKKSLLMTQTDQFQNPIRHEMEQGLAGILADFENRGAQFSEALDQITRVLAIQDFPPSKATALFYELKEIVRELAKKNDVGFGAKEWKKFNHQIEQLTLTAFDSYVDHREKIYQIKVDESKNRAFMLLKKAGL